MSRRKSKNTLNVIQVGREEFLKSKPLRHPESEWKKDERGLHATVPGRQTKVRRFFSKIMPLPLENRVLLDEQGAFIWNLCDGEHQVREIAKKLSEQYKMLVPDAEAALGLYLAQLSKQNLVGFVMPESARKRYHAKFDMEKKVEKNTKQSEK